MIRKTALGAVLAVGLTPSVLAGGFDSPPVAPPPPPPPAEEPEPQANYLPLVIFLLFAGLGVGAN